jgi:hypothetical protein
MLFLGEKTFILFFLQQSAGVTRFVFFTLPLLLGRNGWHSREVESSFLASSRVRGGKKDRENGSQSRAR